MVNPLDIMPILAMAFAIACVPILSDGPFKGTQRNSEPKRKPRIHLPYPRR
jgi:hypothetical protein